MTAHQKTDSALFPADGLDMTWMRISACSTARDLPWTSHGNVSAAQIRKMRDLCTVCPVRAECVRFVEGNGITAGFWAGMSRSAKKIRRHSSSTSVEDDRDAA